MQQQENALLPGGDVPPPFGQPQLPSPAASALLLHGEVSQPPRGVVSEQEYHIVKL